VNPCTDSFRAANPVTPHGLSLHSAGTTPNVTSKADFQIPHLWIGPTPNSPPSPDRRVAPAVPVTPLPLPCSSLLVSSLPYAVHLLSSCSHRLSEEMLNGVLLVGSILWEGRNKEEKTMRLPKAMGLRFVSALGKGVNPVTFVCKAWGCTKLCNGTNVNGNKTNVWSFPTWADGRTVKLRVTLTPSQRKRWKNRRSILLDCSNKANPAAAFVRQTLALTTESAAFTQLAQEFTESGEITAIRCFRATPGKVNITGDGDIQSVVSRLPEALRHKLLIGGQNTAEFDIKSAHAVLLGMFYDGETGEEWAAERERFVAAATLGFPALYGPKKEHKKSFLSALNQSPRVARHASLGYREFERLFPLLAAKTARIRCRNPKALGSILRNRLAVIVRKMVLGNHADGIRSIPVVDSAVVAMPEDLWGKHRAAFRTAWRLGVPLAQQTGVPALIERSNREKYCFFFKKRPQ